jgi:hypothetical protein
VKEALGGRMETQQAIVGHDHHLTGFGATAMWLASQTPDEVSVEQNAKYAESPAKGILTEKIYASEIPVEFCKILSFFRLNRRRSASNHKGAQQKSKQQDKNRQRVGADARSVGLSFKADQVCPFGGAGRP